MRNNTVCFSGHREIPPEELERIKRELYLTVSGLIERGYTVYYTGGAEGFDFLATECVAEMKKEYPDISLNIIFPFKNTKCNRLYKDVILMCDSVEYVSEKYFPWTYHERNRKLVEKSSVCVCYLTKTRGGTVYTVSYASECGREIILL